MNLLQLLPDYNQFYRESRAVCVFSLLQKRGLHKTEKRRWESIEKDPPAKEDEAEDNQINEWETNIKYLSIRQYLKSLVKFITFELFLHLRNKNSLKRCKILSSTANYNIRNAWASWNVFHVLLHFGWLFLWTSSLDVPPDTHQEVPELQRTFHLRWNKKELFICLQLAWRLSDYSSIRNEIIQMNENSCWLICKNLIRWNGEDTWAWTKDFIAFINDEMGHFTENEFRGNKIIDETRNLILDS